MGLFLVFFLSVLHPFHVSICEIDYKTDSQSFQVAHRLFYDDLEDALNQGGYSDNNLDILNAGRAVVDQALTKYLEQNFTIKVNGKEVAAEYLGYEIENDVLWCYLEARGVEFNGQAVIKNTMLTELFADQQNLVHFRYESDTKSLMINRRNTVGELSF